MREGRSSRNGMGSSRTFNEKEKGSAMVAQRFQ